jgi:hypothetical protein
MVLAPDGEFYIATGTDGLDYDDSRTGGRLRIYRGRLVQK